MALLHPELDGGADAAAKQKLLYVLAGRSRLPQGAVPKGIWSRLVYRFRAPQSSRPRAPPSGREDTTFSCGIVRLAAWGAGLELRP